MLRNSIKSIQKMNYFETQNDLNIRCSTIMHIMEKKNKVNLNQARFRQLNSTEDLNWYIK